MVGGPLGALLGAAVGHNFDQGGSKKTAEPDPAGIRDQARSVFNATAFQLMGYLAKADGRVSEREIAAARAVMDHLRLNAGQRRSAIDCFTEGKRDVAKIRPFVFVNEPERRYQAYGEVIGKAFSIAQETRDSGRKG